MTGGKTKLAVGTRFFETEKTDALKSLAKIGNFIEKYRKCSDLVLVAVNIDEDKINSLEILSSAYSKTSSVIILGISPWQKFIPALNAIAYKATTAKMDYLLIQSIEIRPLGKKRLEYLMSHMDEKTISVGVALPEHDFHPGQTVEGNGLTIPWNSCNLWNLKYLGVFGFSFVGDSAFDPSGQSAGVEEFATLSEIQSLKPGTIAKLVEIPGVKWERLKKNSQKQSRHKIKIQTKIKRIEEQIKHSNLKPPKIMHIKYKNG